MNKNISSIKSKNGSLTWINIINADKKEIQYLKRKYKFDDLDLNDSHAKKYAQRPKFYLRSNYAFLILQFPVYNKTTKVITAEEIDFFIGENFVITLHNNKLPPLIKLFNACNNDSFYREQYMSEGNAYLLYSIILGLQEYVYPILDHISLDIRGIEKNIFAGHERQMITKILYIKRNISHIRKILDVHKNIIVQIDKEKTKFLPVQKFNMYYDDLIDHAKNIWEILRGHKEFIESLEDTNNTLVSYRLNMIMKTLTVFSVIVFPLTLLAAIFGMNTVKGMPFMDNPNGFWIIVTIMGVGSIAMFAYFKSRKWL